MIPAPPPVISGRFAVSQPGAGCPAAPTGRRSLGPMTAATPHFDLPDGQVLTSKLALASRAHDASHFLLQPKVVVVPRSAAEVARVLTDCAAAGVSVTFRSGGTSLSGQAGTASVLADTRRYFDGIEILNDGARVKVQPGATVNRVNAHLAPYGRRLGPDPASSAAATIGGVVANNSSGMACGTTQNTYRTLESLQVVLASGTVLDTGAVDADNRLRTLEPTLYAGLAGLRDRIRANPTLVATITQQFSMKNTMGYGLNSFVDYHNPVDILTHLLIGSEGTLGFIASATFTTIPRSPFAATGLLVFPTLQAANQALPGLAATGAATIELMDAASIKVGQRLAHPPSQIAAIQTASQAALLIEYQTTNQTDLADAVAAASPLLAGLALQQPADLTSDTATRNQLWAMRSGLYTAVAAARRPGTTALLEDVVVPVPALADTCIELGQLFDEFGYADSVIFGHAKDGNIHFMITDQFDQQLDRYDRFTNAMVDVVLGHDGSLKAEHGTGRVMAPFVRRQYGDELYDVMKQVKSLFDPGKLLNDGVVISDDPSAHLRHIKTPIAVDPLVDACVECGYCEPVCPSRDLTLTPRQRIAVQREIRQAQAAGDQATQAELTADFVYQGRQTCAVDSLCALACPVGIDTGRYVKQLRAEAASPVAQTGWALAANHWAGATRIASFALSTAHQLTPVGPLISAVNSVGRALADADNLPAWSPDLPAGGPTRRRPPPRQHPDAVYLPACVNAMFGPQPGGTRQRLGVQAAFEALCAKAGLTLLVPPGIDGLCCATPWTSKGMTRGADTMKARVVGPIKKWAHGQLPVVCDASSCTEGFQRLLQDEPDIDVVDCVQFVAQRVLPVLGNFPKLPAITLHQTCSSTHIGLGESLVAVASAVAEQVNLPVDGGCCAFAGDRGMLHPELTAVATRPEATEVANLAAPVHASCNRTCEIGLTRATGQPYRHILEVLAEVALGATQ